MGSSPTVNAVIGKFVNGRNSTDDFLQLATNNGASIFAWIDSNGNFHGNFLNIVANLNLSSTSVIDWNGDTGLSRGSAGVIDVGNGTQGDTSGTLDAAHLITGTLSISGTLTDSTSSVGTSGQVLSSTGTGVQWINSSAAGTVTSFSSGNLSPLFTTSVATPTTTPALSFTAVSQSANLVYVGPATGSAAAPTFRALVVADIPSLPASQITSGTLAVAVGGTGSNLSATGGTSQVLRQSSTGASITVSQLAFTDISGTLGVAAGGTGSNLSVTGGTSQVLRQSSSGASVTVSQLAFTDISGTLGVSAGGTGTSSPALVAGADITITGSWPDQTVAVSTQGGLTAGSYTSANITVDAHGIITAASSGGTVATEVDKVAQSAAIGTTTILTVPASPAGGTNYLLSWNAKVTTPATTSSSLGPLQITYTSPDGATQTQNVNYTIGLGAGALNSGASTFGAGGGGSLAATSIGTTVLINAEEGSTISYAFGYASSGLTAMVYDLHIRLLPL
jgi:hypothetical protein